MKRESECSSDDLINFITGLSSKVISALKIKIEEQYNLSNTTSVNIKELGTFPAKGWFLSQALLQAERVLSALVMFQVNLEQQENNSEKFQKSNFELIQRDYVSQQHRKLRECLARLILFSNTNEEIYYHHYMLIEEISFKRNVISALKDDFDCVPKIFYEQLAELEGVVALAVQKVDYKKVWYADQNKEKIIFKKLKQEKLILKNALDVANEIDRLALGISYYSYVLESRKIHMQFCVSSNQRRKGENLVAYEVLGINVLSVLQHIVMLIPVSSDKSFLELKRFIDSSHLRRIASTIATAKIKPTDIVEVSNHLGMVLLMQENDRGYRRFQIDFGNSPICKDMKVDSYPSSFVHFVMEKEEFDRLVFRRVRKLLNNISLNTVRKKSKDVLSSIVFKNTNLDVRFSGAEIKKNIQEYINESEEVKKLLLEVFN